MLYILENLRRDVLTYCRRGEAVEGLLKFSGRQGPSQKQFLNQTICEYTKGPSPKMMNWAKQQYVLSSLN
jgi:hypothetical protein